MRGHPAASIAVHDAEQAGRTQRAVRGPRWRRHRFALLRGLVAVALMWSSLEKFAFTDWFYPLIAEKPYLSKACDRGAL
ncbi:hypothetical protein SAE02_76230 [Skermanella aerolata]|uniref:Uncharacterized protein n=1 Tax=Skermanella aerolata TaxID=393310 RepID=A0A512E451_9PROT|nr:hypothetical protein N826_40975 [Skermanella aerolata KACC 11604]GEO43475.1 hypothetical protein SAE02_76230 [Skermanella aerolata]